MGGTLEEEGWVLYNRDISKSMGASGLVTFFTSHFRVQGGVHSRTRVGVDLSVHFRDHEMDDAIIRLIVTGPIRPDAHKCWQDSCYRQGG
jgi:hypothetical protein